MLTPATLVQDVASSGTAEALAATETLAYWVRIQAKSGNTGDVYIGDSTVDSDTGVVLDAGELIEFGSMQRNANPVDLSKIYVDAGTNDDGVIVFYLK